MQKHYHFFAQTRLEFLQCKSFAHISAKNISTFDFICTQKLKESLTEGFDSPIALRKAKIVYNFGLSECSRVKLVMSVCSNSFDQLSCSCLCVYSNSRKDVPRVAERYRTIAAHTWRRASVLVMFVVFCVHMYSFAGLIRRMPPQ